MSREAMSEVSNLGTGGRLLQLMSENVDLRTMLLNERNEWDAQHKRQADTNAALAARLAEAEALIAKGLAVVHDFLPNIGRCVLQDYQRMNEFCVEASKRAADSASVCQTCDGDGRLDDGEWMPCPDCAADQPGEAGK